MLDSARPSTSDLPRTRAVRLPWSARGFDRGTRRAVDAPGVARDAAAPLGAALLTLVLCLWRFESPVLWRDELATWTAAQRSVPELFAMLGNVDASAGGFYLFMRGWTAVFGDGTLAMRMPAMLAMAGTAACVVLLGRRAFGRPAGAAAGVVFALLPSVSRYGQEARAYGFVCLTFAVATLLLARAAERPTIRRWAAYSTAVALLGVWHLVALAGLAGHVAWLAARPGSARGAERPSVRRAFLVAVAAGTAPLAPLAAVAGGQRVRQIEWIPRPDLDTLQVLLPRLAASGPVAVALAVLALGACTGPHRRSAAGYFGVALVPVAVVWAVSRAGDTSYFLPRYFLFTLPAWAVLAGAGIAVLADRLAAAGRATGSSGDRQTPGPAPVPAPIARPITPPTATVATAVLLALVAAIGVSDQRQLRAPGAHEQRDYPERSAASWVDYRGIADLLRARQRPGDGIVYASVDQRLWHTDAGVEYYLRGELRPNDVLLGRSGVDRDDLWTYDCLDSEACLRAADPERIWLVVIVLRGVPENPFAGVAGSTAQALRGSYHVVESVAVAGAYVSLMERGATPLAPEGADRCDSPLLARKWGADDPCAATGG
ncbi:glycosyltransferase family 39 protein [Streptodolium elevatio]|uniref:Glycosyltransferase family 39 protein n=1 Tax=Streptodolium elevatio TaxID=3157996 RepID=A0ABV3DUC8_9ACTN